MSQKKLYICISISAVVIEIIQPPFQIRFISKMYRISAVGNEQIIQK